MSKTYEEVAYEVDNMADGLNYPIDQGIKKIVTALRLLGFPTESSCEGHMDRGLQYPWIQFIAQDLDDVKLKEVNKKERKRLIELAEEFRKDVNPDFKYSILDVDDLSSFRLAPEEDIVYGKPNEETKDRCQKSFDEFANFLISKA
ncbi:MAG: hypothetical protein WCP03_03920 [Candidatus Saccharibacteria bacterium]